MTNRRGWGFRARLAALIAGMFIAGGVVLLGVQYLLVQQLFTQGISAISGGCVSRDANPGNAAECSIEARGGGEFVLDGDAGSVVVYQTTLLSQEVLSGLLVWSTVVLFVFAGLAVLAAWWLSKRSLGRIARITETTRAISRDDLHRRLNLTGPDDEIKELGTTIDSMLDRLDEAFERQDRFIAGASHELRTPLTTARALLEIPLAQGRVPDELEPAIRGALEANERSEHLITALLTLARSARTPVQTHTDLVDLSMLALDALREHENEARSRGLSVHASSKSAPAAVDAELAAIAVGNLIENAIRHNHVDGSIHITAETQSDTAHLVIENDGGEFTPGEVARLIEPFNRGDQTRLTGPGTGLGLTLADTIARALGGNLTLAPRGRGGLIITLSLPAAQKEAAPK